MFNVSYCTYVYILCICRNQYFIISPSLAPDISMIGIQTRLTSFGGKIWFVKRIFQSKKHNLRSVGVSGVLQCSEVFFSIIP